MEGKFGSTGQIGMTESRTVDTEVHYDPFYILRIYIPMYIWSIYSSTIVDPGTGLELRTFGPFGCSSPIVDNLHILSLPLVLLPLIPETRHPLIQLGGASKVSFMGLDPVILREFVH